MEKPVMLTAFNVSVRVRGALGPTDSFSVYAENVEQLVEKVKVVYPDWEITSITHTVGRIIL